MVVSRAVRNRFRYELPYPVAINYKRIGACPEPNAVQLMYILKTAEMALRLLGAICLADLRRNMAPGQVPAGALTHGFARRFSSPSLGTWLGLCRESLMLLKRQGLSVFVTELPGFWFDGRGKPSPSVRILEDVVTHRNRFMHDKVPQDEWLSQREIPATCRALLPLLETVLAELLFLVDYPVVVVDPITVRKRRGEDPCFVRDVLCIEGCADTFDMDRQPSSGICETGEVLLLARERGEHLNLDPLLVYSDEGSEEREGRDGSRLRVSTGIHDLFLYNGADHGGPVYSACNRGGELRARETARGAHLKEGHRELLDLFSIDGGSV